VLFVELPICLLILLFFSKFSSFSDVIGLMEVTKEMRRLLKAKCKLNVDVLKQNGENT
jgi:hypothetical protein